MSATPNPRARELLTPFALLLGATVACGPAVELPSAEAGEQTTTAPGPMTSPSPTATAGDPTTAPSTAGESGDPPPTSGDGSSTSGSTGDSIGFIGEATDCYDPEVQPRCSMIECSIWDQDCPDGEKCAPWANDGGNAWNALRCGPVGSDAAGTGEPCTVEGSAVSGIDSCDVGGMCWDVDPDTNTGECAARCGGTPEDPVCPEQTDCMVANDGTLALCLPTCDPLAETPCADGHSCHPDYRAWKCMPDGAEIHLGILNPPACVGGTTAVEHAALPTCDDFEVPCCATICDVNAPACDAELECVLYFDGGTAGVCITPA